jgi:diadenosine tetraphosphatase ApaH/serine/threonine PP2A family protein phosphatase
VRYLIISDLHSNLHALQAVLREASAIGYDAVLCLGDLVGYGAHPREVIAETMALTPATIVRGNHDKVCAGLESAMHFSDVARISAEWTRSVLTPADVEILASLPAGPVRVTDSLEICHGTPFDEDHYLFDEEDARRSTKAMSAALCLFGHTHVPAIFSNVRDLAGSSGQPGSTRDHAAVPLPRTGRTLINVGSVGQPRDGDPRAAYGLYDTERHGIRLMRVVYDVKGAQQAILSAGLPTWLALRLERGQ